MKQSIQSHLPYDISLKIVSSLPAWDVCSLGSSSWFWRELCGSNDVWEVLYQDRWPRHYSFSPSPSVADIHINGWKGVYKKRHCETANKASALINLVEQCSPTESIEVSDYLSAMRDLSSMEFEFKDVQMFLFKPKLNALLNLVGLHYCITWLQVPADELMEALDISKISEREVCARWWKLGRWFYGFRMKDESCSRQFSLRDFATSKEDEILAVLQRGAIHEVLRVQISVAKPLSAPWSCQFSSSLA